MSGARPTTPPSPPAGRGARSQPEAGSTTPAGSPPKTVFTGEYRVPARERVERLRTAELGLKLARPRGPGPSLAPSPPPSPPAPTPCTPPARPAPLGDECPAAPRKGKTRGIRRLLWPRNSTGSRKGSSSSSSNSDSGDETDDVPLDRRADRSRGGSSISALGKKLAALRPSSSKTAANANEMRKSTLFRSPLRNSTGRDELAGSTRAVPEGELAGHYGRGYPPSPDGFVSMNHDTRVDGKSGGSSNGDKLDMPAPRLIKRVDIEALRRKLLVTGIDN